MANIKIDKGRVDEYPLGERIRYFRKRRGLLQVQLAKKVGITQGALSQLEKSQMDPSLKLLRDLARELNVHIARLFESDDVFVFEMKQLRKRYRKRSDLTPSLTRAIDLVREYIQSLE